MKRLLMFVLLLGVGVSCHQKSDVNPNDPLYRTWQVTQWEDSTGKVNTPTQLSDYLIVTFRPNGQILYGANGRLARCCVPDRAKRKGNVLDLININDIPIAPTDNPNSKYVCDCVGQGNQWLIEELTPTRLVISGRLGKTTYKPYP